MRQNSQDVLNISVWKEPDLSSNVPVRPDGKISLPLLNDVQAAGLTPMQLADALKEKLQKFISAPQVSVIVTAVNSQRVYILGEVARPGAMPMLGDMTVMQAISNAGGLSQFANAKGIYVLRTQNGAQQRLAFNYKQAIKGGPGAQDIALKPGDTIVIP
jgi:polysaccharide biosynthesis/export protein